MGSMSRKPSTYLVETTWSLARRQKKAVKMMGSVLSGEIAQPNLHRPQGLIPSTTRKTNGKRE